MPQFKLLLKYREAILYSLLVLLILGYIIYQTIPKGMEVYTIYQSKAGKRAQIVDLETRLNDLKRIQTKKEDSVVEIKKLYKQDSPDMDLETAFTVTFEDVINMAKYNGVKVFSLKYTYNPQDDEFVTQSSNNYNVCLLETELVSDYEDFKGFLQELYKYPYLINIDTIQLVPYAKNKKILLIKLKLKLYTKKQSSPEP